jgi:hypothetical protein
MHVTGRLAGARDRPRPEGIGVTSPDSAGPAFFRDLNFDQVVDAVVAGREDLELAPFLYEPLRTVQSIEYRQDVFRDLDRAPVLAAVTSFVHGMQAMRLHLARAGNLRTSQQQAWYLEAVADDRVTVTRYDGGEDYGAQVEEAFRRFRRGATDDPPVQPDASREMNHVELAVLGLVAKLYPDQFGALADFCDRNRGYLDGTVAVLDREVQFYLAYLSFLEPLKESGLPARLSRVGLGRRAAYTHRIAHGDGDGAKPCRN